MSYKFLDHTTDAIIEVHGEDLDEAFKISGIAVVDLMINRNTVDEKEVKNIITIGKDVRYLLFSWLEELIILTITEGFAIRDIECKIKKNNDYKIEAKCYGEPLDLKKHQFKVEVKAPTFYEMEIETMDKVRMKFLLDL